MYVLVKMQLPCESVDFYLCKIHNKTNECSYLKKANEKKCIKDKK